MNNHNEMTTTELKETVDRLEHEIEQIGQIQERLLPDAMPDIPSYEFAASHSAHGKAGGDYYDFLSLDRDEDGQPRPDGRWAIIVADAAGHGPSAAVVMAMLQSILHAFTGPSDHPARLVEHANLHLCGKDLTGVFATAIVAVLSPKSHRVVYSCAGHEPPLIRRKDGVVERLHAAGGLPLGVEEDQEYESGSYLLRPGETMLLYTDGLADAMSPTKERFGADRVVETVSRCAGDARSVVKALNRALALHRRGADQTDDETLLAISRVAE